MCKVLKIYQQTFHQTDDQANKGVFQFPRYMKTHHSQYFRIKVLAVQSFKENPIGSLFIRDFPVITMNCNYINNLADSEQGNRFYLGTLQNQQFVDPPTMIVDDIPMSPFTIERTSSEHFGNDFMVVFQIELMQPEN